jgi:hypothetical protein
MTAAFLSKILLETPINSPIRAALLLVDNDMFNARFGQALAAVLLLRQTSLVSVAFDGATVENDGENNDESEVKLVVLDDFLTFFSTALKVFFLLLRLTL